MNVEETDTHFIEVGPPRVDPPPAKPIAPPPADSALTFPAYPEELDFGAMFSDPQSLGGWWDAADDDELALTLPLAEVKTAAANLHWLAFQEQIPLEEIAPVADFYREAYNQQWFGGRAKTSGQFYDAIAARIQQRQAEEDDYDEQAIEQTWRTEHPVLDFALRFIHEAAGTVLDTFGARPRDEPLTRAEAYENYQESLRRLASLNVNSFNPTQAVFHDNGHGRLELNPEGLGSLTGGILAGKGIRTFSGEARAFKIKLRAKQRAVSAQERAEAISGATYDPESKVFIKDGQPIPDEDIPELFQRKAAEPSTSSNSTVDSNRGASTGDDRKIDAYDRATDTYYHRGRIIADQGIEEYLDRKDGVISRLKEADEKVPASISDFVKVSDSSPLYPAKNLPLLASYLGRRRFQLMETTKDPHSSFKRDGSGVIFINRYASILQVKHELCHYLDFKRLGFIEYTKLTRKQRELAVVKRLKKNRIWNTLDANTRLTSIQYANDPEN